MTRELLNSYPVIKARLEVNKEKLWELRGRTVQSPCFDAEGGKTSSGRNVTEEKYINAIEEKNMLERLIKADTETLARIEKYIGRIKNDVTRFIFERHVIDGEKFWKIAMALGDRHSGESVKIRFYRYINSHPYG